MWPSRAARRGGVIDELQAVADIVALADQEHMAISLGRLEDMEKAVPVFKRVLGKA